MPTTNTVAERAASPSLNDSPAAALAAMPDSTGTSTDAPPDADGDAEVYDVPNGQNLADLGGEADDGDDSDPHKFIEKSLHYQDMLMTKRHAEERVAFFEEFKKTMPKGKDPKKKMELYEARVKAVHGRITKFRAKYAEKRSEGRKSRGERIAKDKEARKEKDLLGKDLQSAIRKDMNSKQDLATKAALAAIAKLEDDATEEQREKAAAAAFATAMAAEMSKNPFKLPLKEVKEKKAKPAKSAKSAKSIEASA